MAAPETEARHRFEVIHREHLLLAPAKPMLCVYVLNPLSKYLGDGKHAGVLDEHHLLLPIPI